MKRSSADLSPASWPDTRMKTRKCFFSKMGVDEAYQRNGTGTQPIEKLKTICAQRGIMEMFEDAFAGNLPARGLSKSPGGLGAKVVEFRYKPE